MVAKHDGCLVVVTTGWRSEFVCAVVVELGVCWAGRRGVSVVVVHVSRQLCLGSGDVVWSGGMGAVCAVTAE